MRAEVEYPVEKLYREVMVIEIGIEQKEEKPLLENAIRSVGQEDTLTVAIFAPDGKRKVFLKTRVRSFSTTMGTLMGK